MCLSNPISRWLTAFFLLCSVAFLASGQTSKMGQSSPEKISDRQATLHFPDYTIDTSLSTSSMVRLLRTQHLNEQHKGSNFRLNTRKKSPGGHHLLFAQTFAGYSIYNASLKLNLAHDGEVMSLFDNTLPTEKWDQTSLKDQGEVMDAAAIARSFIRSKYEQEMKLTHQKVIVKRPDQEPEVMIQIKATHSGRVIHDLHLVNEDGQAVFTRDLNRYGQAASDTTEKVDAAVFLPDPLTTAKKTYGGSYVNANDSDRAVLNNERVTRQMPVTKQGNNYILKNEFVELVDFSSPNVAPVKSPVAFFNYTRAESGFEDVNVFYHITQFNQYLDSLGFDSLMNYAIHADAHGLNGNDQSVFTPGTSPPRISFGEGGVDDGEDADVIVHEYGHAISHSASPQTNNGSERNALEEGLCDFIAASYSHAVDSFKWYNVFSWDGHNEFWPGRLANTDKTYAKDYEKGSSIHANGEIFSSTLMDLHFLIGRNVTNSLLFQSMYSYASNMTMPQAARLLLEADTTLYNGAHYCTIQSVLTERELTDNLPDDSCNVLNDNIDVHAGADVVKCPEEKTKLGGSPTSNLKQASFQWRPTKGLSNPQSPNPVVSVDSTTTYTVWAITPKGNNADQVKVKVEACYDEIRFLNSSGFSKGASPLLIKFPPETENVTIRIYDARGRVVKAKNQPSNSTIEISGREFAEGVYLIDVQTNLSQTLHKVAKF